MTSNDEKPAVEQPDYDHEEVKKINEEHLHAVAIDIDRQMKTLAEMDTRVLIAKERLIDFQEMIQERIHAYQEKKDGDPSESHSDILQSILHAKDEAAKHIKESEAINDAYDKLLKQLEKGREATRRESKKAEKVFKEKFHELEAKLKQKAGEIKENIKNK